MEQTLKITNVLADPTRYHIYQYIVKQHKEVIVQEIADAFEIHPNVARMHLTKLQDVSLITSETKKTGKGGRPGRTYKLADEVIQLHFPYRDYQLLAKIAIESMMSLGEAGEKALFETGRAFGSELVKQQNMSAQPYLTFDEKLAIVRNAATLAGFSPEFQISEDQTTIYFQIHNCPFKELAKHNSSTICAMHNAYLLGMFNSVFTNVQLVENENMIKGCDLCSYRASVTD